MAFSLSRRQMLAGAGAALALGGAVAFSLAASAQQPPPGGQAIIACAAFGAASGGEQGVVIEGGRAEHLDFAGDLARALGKPRAEVERALEQVRSTLPPLGQTDIVAAHDGVPGEGLQPIATSLGVTVDDLTRAMEAAAPCPSPPPAGTQPSGGSFTVMPLDPAQHFAAIATQLGRGITGEQVRAAFDANRPADAEVEITNVVLPPTQYLQALARALGVTVDQLEAALRQIAPRRR